jgi:hypothetical protein
VDKSSESLNLSEVTVDDDFKLIDIDSKQTNSSATTEEVMTVTTPKNDFSS